MYKLSTSYLILLVVLGSITLTTVLADTVTVTTYPYVIPSSGSSNPGLSVASTGNVGIGTTTPQEKLDVAGNIRLSGSGISTIYTGAATNDIGIYSGESAVIDIDHTNSFAHQSFSVTKGGGTSTLLDIPENGNVGIGTTTPQEKLDVAGNIRLSGSGISTIYTGAATNDIGIYSGESAVIDIDHTNSFAHQSFSVTKGGGLTTILYIPETGNVGIGTTNPAQKLDIVGNIQLTGNIVSPNDICIGTC